MIFDITYKLFRKILPAHLYSLIRRSRIGREEGYFTLDTYKEIYSYYKTHGLDAKGKTICELGSGRQFFTAFYMLADGAEEVILIDPVFPENISAIIEEQLIVYKKQFNTEVNIDVNRVKHFNTLKDLDKSRDNKIDFVCSHFVLEHFEDLESFFAGIQRLLKPGGISLNRVDLSDHTYHILVKYPLLFKLIEGHEIDYFRYSDKTFNFINDSKCYMNRIPLPVYLKQAEAHNLSINKLEVVNVSKAAKPHNDIIKKYKIEEPDLLQTSEFTISFRKN